MKKIYCAAFTVLFGAGVSAQNIPQVPPAERSVQIKTEKQYTGTEELSKKPIETRADQITRPVQLKNAVLGETVIGFTNYDLQSNSAVQNRIYKSGNSISAAFTMSLNSTPFNDRGTGYNYNDNGVWDSEPYERIETQRVGWPSMIRTSDKEWTIAHQAESGLIMNSRDIGTGSWTEEELETASTGGLLWARAAAGGEDGNSIHIICVTTPVANEGEIYQGLDGALLYYRSTDNGETWDIQDAILPGLDSTQFVGFSGDTYAIHARNNTVAFAVFNDLADSFVMISHDNGDSWEKTILVDFPVDMYVLDDVLPEIGEDWDEDGVFSEFFNTDGAGAIVVDNAEKVHVTFGDMYYQDDDGTDDTFTFFPGVNGLSYWQEGWEAETLENIAYCYDLDENGQLDLDDLPLYFVSLASMPSMGVDADDNVYVTYASVIENFSNGQNFRHIYAVYSEDNGITWNSDTACDITPDLDFDEYESVFGSLAPDVDDDLHIVYQRDFEPGLHVRGDQDPSDLNDIIYLEMPVAGLAACENTSVQELFLEASDISLYPNPAEGEVTVAIQKAGTSEIRILDLTGKVVLETTTNSMIEILDISNLNAGMYVIEVGRNGQSTSQKLHVR